MGFDGQRRVAVMVDREERVAVVIVKEREARKSC